MAKKSKVVANYFYNTIFELIRILTPIITTPYVARVLGADGVGIFSFAQSISAYFVLLASMGTGLYAQREIAYLQDNPKERTKVFWEVEIFSFCTAIISTICFYFIFATSGDNALIFKILTFEILANAFDISWLYKGMENFKVIVIRNTLVRILGIILIFVFVKSAEDLGIYTICYALPIFVGNLSLWISVKRYIVKIKGKVLKGIPKHIKPILVLFIPQVAVEVYAVLDKTMIGVLSANMSQVGYYTQAQKIIKILLLIVTSLGTVMLPAMSSAFARGESEKVKQGINNAFNFVFLIAFPLMFGLCAVASRFVPFFFGEGYDLVAPLMIVISPIIIIIGMSNVIGRQYLLPTKQQNAYTISVVVGAGVNLVLNYFLIRKFNAIGASIATIVAELSVTSVQMWHVRKQLQLKGCLSSISRYFIMGLIMFVATWGTGKLLPNGDGYLIIMIAVGTVVYGLELIITKDPMLMTGFEMVKKKVGRK